MEFIGVFALILLIGYIFIIMPWWLIGVLIAAFIAWGITENDIN